MLELIPLITVNVLKVIEKTLPTQSVHLAMPIVGNATTALIKTVQCAQMLGLEFTELHV